MPRGGPRCLDGRLEFTRASPARQLPHLIFCERDSAIAAFARLFHEERDAMTRGKDVERSVDPNRGEPRC